MGIVLPDSILGSPGLGYIREWLIKNHRIIASIDLNVDTFQPRNGTQTSVLFLQKKTQHQKDAEEKSGTMQKTGRSVNVNTGLPCFTNYNRDVSEERNDA